MASRHVKRCSMLLIIREMKIKTTISRFGQMAIIKKNTNNKYWRGCGEKGSRKYCWWECKLGWPLWRMSEGSLKTKIRSTICSSSPTFGHIPGRNKNSSSKRPVHPVFIAALFTIARTWRQPKCPSTEEGIKKRWYIYTMEYYSTLKNEILPFAVTWMDPEIIILSEASQTEKGKYHTISLICGMWKMNLFIKQTDSKK